LFGSASPIFDRGRQALGALERAGPGVTLGLGLLVALLTWPGRGTNLIGGLDPSWHAALHLAAQRGLHFGSDLVFSYGPLGYLFVPEPYLGRSSLAALFVGAAVHVSLCTILVRCARRAFPLGVAFGLAYLAARVSSWLDVPELTVFIAFAVGVEIIWRGRHSPVPAWVIVALGALAGPAALGKINTGVVVVGLGLVASAFAHRPWWRGIGVYVSSASGGALLAWLISGQRIEDVVPFVRHSTDIVLGYSAAMGVRIDVLQGLLFAAGICMAILAAVAIRVTEEWPPSARIGLALLGATLAFAAWKTGFTRWHFQFFFATALLALFPLMLGRLAAATGSWAFVGLLLAFVATSGGNPVTLLDPVRSFGAARDFVEIAVNRERRAIAVAANHSEMQRAYALSREAQELLEGGTVHTDTVETGVMWVYPHLDWVPYPVFQSFLAYTPDLDALNGAALAAADGPEFLIRGRAYGTDNRFVWWETPRAILEVLCRYREVHADEIWQILQRGDSGCGLERPIGEVTARPGQEIAVPRAGAGELVVARVHGLEPTLGDRVITFLLRGPEWKVTINDTQTFRMVPAHAGGPLVMSVPASVGYTPPHSFPEAVVSLSFARVDDPDAATADITVEFFAIEFGAAR
jgi:hypothetical protein